MNRVYKLATFLSFVTCSVIGLGNFYYSSMFGSSQSIDLSSFSKLNNSINAISKFETIKLDSSKVVLAKSLAQISLSIDKSIKLSRSSFKYLSPIHFDSNLKVASTTYIRKSKVYMEAEINDSDLLKLPPIHINSTITAGLSTYLKDINLQKVLAGLSRQYDHKQEIDVKIAKKSETKVVNKGLVAKVMNDPKDISLFKPAEQSILEDVISNSKAKNVSTQKYSDDLVFMDLKKEDKREINKLDNSTNTSKAEVLSSQTPQLATVSSEDLTKVNDHERVISKVVSKAVSRAIKSLDKNTGKHKKTGSKLPPVTVEQSLNTQMSTQSSAGMAPEYSKLLSLVQSKKGKSSSSNNKHFISRVKLRSFAVDIGSKKQGFEKVHDLEFIPEYDKNISVTDDTESGIIEFSAPLNSSMSMIRGTILTKGLVPTKVDVPFEEGQFDLDIPLISQDSVNKMLDSLELQGIGSFLLLELDENIDAVDIDAEYERKLFLDSRFKVVSEEKSYDYVFFVGVTPGNTLLRYLTFDDREAQKIVHLTEDEVYFEGAALNSSKNEKITLLERNILGNTTTELAINESNINVFNTDIKASSIGINSYEYSRPILPLGMRKYLELKHLDESLFAGHWENGKIEIPSSEFIANIYSFFEIDSLQKRCMVQINFSKKLKNFTFSGETMSGPLNYKMYYLDKDGMFADEVNSLSKKAFILGDLEGVINSKIEYADGTEDYIQTFCSQDTYLVEQL